MAGTTTKLKWPFPVSTDLIAQGADTIGQMAQAIENSIILPDNANNADAFVGAYPTGLSTMGISSPASAGNWPPPNTGAAFVLTYRGAISYQFYFAGSALPYGFLMRQITTSSVGTWVPVNGILPADTFAASELGASYPPGNSAMAISSNNFAALGWPLGAGQVTTYRNSTGSVCFQFYMTGTTGQLLFRFNGTTQSAWQTLIGASVPTAAAAGTISAAAITTNVVTAIPVTFPANRFTSTPRVFAEILGSTPQSLALSISGANSAGFTANAWSTSPVAISFYWYAVQGAT